MRLNIRVIAIAMCMSLLAGCSSLPFSNSTSAQTQPTVTPEVQRLRDQLAKSNNELEMQRMQRERAERELRTVQTKAKTDRVAGNVGMPPNAKTGECYARVIVPAKFETTSKPVMVSPAGEKVDIIPAQYRLSEKKVVVTEASTRLKVVPATYKTITEKVIVKPASRKVVQVPAKYRTIKEKVIDKPAYTAWKTTTGVGQGAGSGVGGAAMIVERYRTAGFNVLDSRVESTGEVMCLVEVPATYRTIEKKVLLSPAKTEVQNIPAEYRTITKKVVDRPATTRKVVIPAKYKNIKVKEVVKPARKVVTPIPAKYETTKLTKKVANEKVQWAPVLCEVNMTPENVSTLQSAIRSQDPGCWKCGRVDGVMGRCTFKATQCYSDKRGLPSGEKFVTIETIRSLGLNFRK